MASIYYLQLEDKDKTVFSLHATYTIDLSMSSQITSFPTEVGGYISDNIVLQPKTISLEGGVSDVKNLRRGMEIKSKKAISLLEKVYKDREVFTFFYGKDIPALKNCVIESLSITQGGDKGTFSGFFGTYSSYGIRMVIKQIRLAEALKTSKITAEELKDVTDKQKAVSGTTTTPPESKGVSGVTSAIKDVAGGAGGEGGLPSWKDIFGTAEKLWTF